MNYLGIKNEEEILAAGVNTPLILGSIITMAVSISLYFIKPKKDAFPYSITIYLISSALVGWAIWASGDTYSPYIALWLVVSIFSSLFGAIGWITILVADLIFLAAKYLSAGLLSYDLTILIVVAVLPFMVSFLIWRKISKNEEADKNSMLSYNGLATELNEVANKSEVVINAIGDGVIAIDTQGVIQLINPAAQSLIGWGKQDALALNYKSILKLVNIKDEPLDVTNDPIQQALNTNQEIRTNKLILITKNDKKLAISLVVSPVGEAGAGVIVVFRDVTKEKAEEREQAEFISTASHEMRTPVASIEGYLGLALNHQTAQIDDRARGYILKAHDSAQHLGHLFQDLLDVSKSEDGRMSDRPHVFNMVTFVHDMLLGLRPKARDKGLQLTFKPIPDDSNTRIMAPEYMVNLDSDHIQEVINNLVDNAIKYTPKGEVVVDITGDEEHVTISVKDSGIGIPAEDMPHLFQKFYRVDNKDTHEIGGTGLGLYLCRKLVELMEGRIWVESARNKGSTFFVEVPRISSQEAISIKEQEKNHLNQKTLTDATSQSTQDTESDDKQPDLNVVPRGDALTPEQIKEYVAKQSALAKQQESEQPNKEQDRQA